MKSDTNNNKHSFHLVDLSPWPLYSGFFALCLTLGGVIYMHYSKIILLGMAFFMILVMMYSWWKDVIREATIEGEHTQEVQLGIKIGVILFIASEIMFFFAFFWAFFHSSFNPSLIIGGVWPPMYITTINPWSIPLVNTILLLSSGASVTWAHHAIVYGNKNEASIALLITITLAKIFTMFQGYEYLSAPFNISDSVYGCTFYMATGFHGFHVLIGTCFLIVCYFRLIFGDFTTTHHLGFEAAAWYWHFVDVVWLFLFITIYWWGS